MKEVVPATSNDLADARSGIFNEGSRKLGTDGTSGRRSSSAKDRLSTPTKIAVRQRKTRGAAKLSQLLQEPNQDLAGARRD